MACSLLMLFHVGRFSDEGWITHKSASHKYVCNILLDPSNFHTLFQTAFRYITILAGGRRGHSVSMNTQKKALGAWCLQNQEHGSSGSSWFFILTINSSV